MIQSPFVRWTVENCLTHMHGVRPVYLLLTTESEKVAASISYRGQNDNVMYGPCHRFIDDYGQRLGLDGNLRWTSEDALGVWLDVVVHNSFVHTSTIGAQHKQQVYIKQALCAAFLANIGTQSDATVNFNDNSYQLPPWSVSMLLDCKNVVLNTAKINSATTIPKFVHQSSSDAADASRGFLSGWSWFNEPVGVSSSNVVMKPGLLEQINTTADEKDYGIC